MTIFAGALSLQSTALTASLKTSFRLNLRSLKDGKGHLDEHDQLSFFLLKWDSGAFAEPVWRTSLNGSLCTLAGDPLFLQQGRKLHRDQQVEHLSPDSSPMNETALAQCRGSFALLHYDSNKKTLFLTTDMVGLRSIYYVVQEGILLFSTALRVLESMPEIHKKLSLSGMAELSAFSFPLAERTPYEGIKILRESEILIANHSGTTLKNYGDWTIKDKCSDHPTEAAAHIYAVFQEAINIRVNRDQRVYSFLSGGMDSRAIVATLISMGRHVEALNFSSTDSQDQRYAQLLAAEAGPLCRLHCLPGGNYPNFSFLALAAKTSLEQRAPTLVDRPQFIWSGDGGSVGLGHVYMDQKMIDYGHQDDLTTAVQHFFEFNHISLAQGILTASARKLLPSLLRDNVMAEINRYPREDIGRRIYLFLLFNDQRRHLFKHFETIDQHGLELLTPFFDSKFLKAVAATPANWGISHRLYAKFFNYLPAFALKTPWQTYPGHETCPIPRDQTASYQWDKPVKAQSSPMIDRSKLALALIGTIQSNKNLHIFSPARIWLAALLHAAGLRDCQHLLPSLKTYQKYEGLRS